MNFPSHLRNRARPLMVLLQVVATAGRRVRLVCDRCGYDRGWVEDLTVTERARQPCPTCNGGRRPPPDPVLS